MWSCITLYNRPQVCFTPDLQPEWLLALICIFMGCICITTTVILLASSHFDRNVIPYARWVGFAASKKFYYHLLLLFIMCNCIYKNVYLKRNYSPLCLFIYYILHHIKIIIIINKLALIITIIIMVNNFF